jgi:integral membrane protein|tara:strand:+ start:424 stop:702 length:279 start_codon:yes stop_codon:yes gene_type:complete
MNISIQTFRVISLLEALSFIVLLLIAMPVKYLLGNPELVRVVGMAHGILFVLYILGAFVFKNTLNWSNQVLGVVILCSIIPLGPFYVDRKYL